MTAFRLIPERKPRGLLVRLFTGAPPQCDYSRPRIRGKSSGGQLGFGVPILSTDELLNVPIVNFAQSCGGPLFRHDGCKHVSCDAHLALFLVADAVCCPECSGRVEVVEARSLLPYVRVKVNHACAHSVGYPVDATMRDLVAAGEAMREAIGGNPCPECSRV